MTDVDDNADDQAQSSSGRQTCRILCFTWNTQSIRMAETVGAGNQSASLLSYKRYDPDFVPAVLDALLNNECDLFVCALQESAKPGSYLMSHALPEALRSIDYELLHRTRLMGIGATTFQRLRSDFDFVSRGLRLAVFARRAWLRVNPHIALDDGHWPATTLDSVTGAKGGIAISVHVPGVGRIAFLNCHLPFDARSVACDNVERVLGSMTVQASALNSLLQQVERIMHPHYYVVMGDLNFRLLNMERGVDPAHMWERLTESDAERRRIWMARDELYMALQYGHVAPFCEGVNNAGPSHFMPTGKMRHGRQPGSTDRRAYFFGHGAAQNPSWCDRILYGNADRALRCAATSQSQQRRHADIVGERREPNEGDGDIRCLLYDRFEIGQCMVRSDHTAVIGMLDIDYAFTPNAERQRFAVSRYLCDRGTSLRSERWRPVVATAGAVADQAAFSGIGAASNCVQSRRQQSSASSTSTDDNDVADEEDDVILLQRIASDDSIHHMDVATVPGGASSKKANSIESTRENMLQDAAGAVDASERANVGSATTQSVCLFKQQTSMSEPAGQQRTGVDQNPLAAQHRPAGRQHKVDSSRDGSDQFPPLRGDAPKKRQGAAAGARLSYFQAARVATGEKQSASEESETFSDDE